MVTCIAMTADNRVLVSGSADGTVVVWDVSTAGGLVAEVPRRTLRGHDDEVTCVAVRDELEVVVSGSKVGGDASRSLPVWAGGRGIV